MSIQPHNYTQARAHAECLRRAAWQELWRHAGLLWARRMAPHARRTAHPQACAGSAG